jgi:hypothetical protein
MTEKTELIQVQAGLVDTFLVTRGNNGKIGLHMFSVPVDGR